MSEPKLPPGWTWGAEESHAWAPRLARANGPDGSIGSWPPERTAELVWSSWSDDSGITREKWDAMERDHRAMEALRAAYVENHPGLSMVGVALVIGADDPADAILAALGDES